jgi:rare lipoprotein A (peptidoglycan hydrolase)
MVWARVRPSASGDRFDHRKMTAAHKKLPLGARVRVIHVASGGSVDVTINDRGPHRRERIIDLSPAAARRLDIMASGLAEVRIEVYAGAHPTDEIRAAVLDMASAATPEWAWSPDGAVPATLSGSWPAYCTEKEEAKALHGAGEVVAVRPYDADPMAADRVHRPPARQPSFTSK